MKTPIPTDADLEIIAGAAFPGSPMSSQTVRRQLDHPQSHCLTAWRAILAERARVRREKSRPGVYANFFAAARRRKLDHSEISAGLQDAAKAVGCRVGVADAKMFYGKGRKLDHLGMALAKPKARKP